MQDAVRSRAGAGTASTPSEQQPLERNPHEAGQDGYPTLPKAKKEVERKKWDGIRESFRQKWSKKFGEWPEEGDISWPGHHIRDLWHGGDPIDPNNIIPAEPGVHDEYGRQYPGCYAGRAPWNTVGPDLPYTDN